MNGRREPRMNGIRIVEKCECEYEIKDRVNGAH